MVRQLRQTGEAAAAIQKPVHGLEKPGPKPQGSSKGTRPESPQRPLRERRWPMPEKHREPGEGVPLGPCGGNDLTLGARSAYGAGGGPSRAAEAGAAVRRPRGGDAPAQPLDRQDIDGIADLSPHSLAGPIRGQRHSGPVLGEPLQPLGVADIGRGDLLGGGKPDRRRRRDPHRPAGAGPRRRPSPGRDGPRSS